MTQLRIEQVWRASQMRIDPSTQQGTLLRINQVNYGPSYKNAQGQTCDHELGVVDIVPGEPTQINSLISFCQ